MLILCDVRLIITIDVFDQARIKNLVNKISLADEPLDVSMRIEFVSDDPPAGLEYALEFFDGRGYINMMQDIEAENEIKKIILICRNGPDRSSVELIRTSRDPLLRRQSPKKS